MRRGIILINITFVLAATALLSTQQQAFADDMQAQRAIKLLARSEALDSKCKFLNSADRDELTALMARAELAMAKRTTVDITKNAMTLGHASGKNATCTEAEHGDLNLILSAAKQAVAKVTVPPVQEQVATMIPARPVVQPLKTPRIKIILNADAPTEPVAQPHMKAGLSQYASLTERYYLARRCGSMSAREISGFYQTVVNTHQSVLSTFGRSAVATVMQQSESKANAQSCG